MLARSDRIWRQRRGTVRSAAFRRSALILLRLTQSGSDLQIWRIRRQIKSRRTDSFDGLHHPGHLMVGPFIAPSITRGATIPSSRRPATKVMVFQCPCGTYPTNRWPRRLRPLSRTILVLVAVSSMNTSRAGSSRPCSRIHRRRARATSARSCSAARRLFLKVTSCLSKNRHTALRLPGMVPRMLVSVDQYRCRNDQ